MRPVNLAAPSCSNGRPWSTRGILRFGWPVLALVALLAFLWFPFDWLATVWPAFGVPFRAIFHNAHDHFIGHTVFFFVIGVLVLAVLPTIRRKPLVYFLGLVLAALAQETIQAIFRGQIPTYNDWNAFRGDALGGTSAFALWLLVALLQSAARRHRPGRTP